jgi:hypothetical protein
MEDFPVPDRPVTHTNIESILAQPCARRTQPWELAGAALEVMTRSVSPGAIGENGTFGMVGRSLGTGDDKFCRRMTTL